MKFPQPKTFRDATSPVTLFRLALGLGTIEYPTGHRRRVLSVCLSGTYLLLFLYFVSMTALENLWKFQGNSYSGTTYYIFTVTTTTCGIFSLYLGQARSMNVVDSLCKLENVNKMLNNFGIPKEYGPTFKSQIVHLIGIFLYMLTIVLLSSIKLYTDASLLAIGSIISRHYILLVSCLDNYTFSIYIRYIGKRFRHLNMYLVKSSSKDGTAAPWDRDLPNHNPWLLSTALESRVQSEIVVVADQQRMMQILRNTKKIHRELYTVAKNLNEAFSVQILLSMTMAIALITALLFNTYNILFKPIPTMTNTISITLINSLWIAFHATQVFWVISACAMAATEAQRTRHVIHELIKPTTTNEIRNEIHALSLQLMQNPLQFTAYGFFSLDKTMIRAMIGTVTTYLVIMIQMPYHPVDISPMNSTIPASNETM